MQDQQQKAELAAQAHMHSTSICALPIICSTDEPTKVPPLSPKDQQQWDAVPAQHVVEPDEYMQELLDNRHQPAMALEAAYEVQQAKRAMHEVS